MNHHQIYSRIAEGLIAKQQEALRNLQKTDKAIDGSPVMLLLPGAEPMHGFFIKGSRKDCDNKIYISVRVDDRLFQNVIYFKEYPSPNQIDSFAPVAWQYTPEPQPTGLTMNACWIKFGQDTTLRLGNIVSKENICPNNKNYDYRIVEVEGKRCLARLVEQPENINTTDENLCWPLNEKILAHMDVIFVNKDGVSTHAKILKVKEGYCLIQRGDKAQYTIKFRSCPVAGIRNYCYPVFDKPNLCWLKLPNSDNIFLGRIIGSTNPVRSVVSGFHVHHAQYFGERPDSWLRYEHAICWPTNTILKGKEITYVGLDDKDIHETEIDNVISQLYYTGVQFKVNEKTMTEIYLRGAQTDKSASAYCYPRPKEKYYWLKVTGIRDNLYLTQASEEPPEEGHVFRVLLNGHSHQAAFYKQPVENPNKSEHSLCWPATDAEELIGQEVMHVAYSAAGGERSAKIQSLSRLGGVDIMYPDSSRTLLVSFINRKQEPGVRHYCYLKPAKEEPPQFYWIKLPGVEGEYLGKSTKYDGPRKLVYGGSFVEGKAHEYRPIEDPDGLIGTEVIYVNLAGKEMDGFIEKLFYNEVCVFVDVNLSENRGIIRTIYSTAENKRCTDYCYPKTQRKATAVASYSHFKGVAESLFEYLGERLAVESRILPLIECACGHDSNYSLILHAADGPLITVNSQGVEMEYETITTTKELMIVLRVADKISELKTFAWGTCRFTDNAEKHSLWKEVAQIKCNNCHQIVGSGVNNAAFSLKKDEGWTSKNHSYHARLDRDVLRIYKKQSGSNNALVGEILCPTPVTVSVNGDRYVVESYNEIFAFNKDTEQGQLIQYLVKQPEWQFGKPLDDGIAYQVIRSLLT